MRQKPSSHHSIDAPVPMTSRTGGSAGSPKGSVHRSTPLARTIRSAWVIVSAFRAAAIGPMVGSTGTQTRSSFLVMDETSQPIELLLSVTRDGSRTLGAQIEDQLRRAIRDGTLRAGARVPSTRDLARQLGISRRIAVEAYAQLAAEGYLSLRQGARPRVSETAAATASTAPPPAAPPAPRFDFRPSVPDVTAFPRAAWLRCLREAVK